MVATRFLVANHHETLLNEAFGLVSMGGCRGLQQAGSVNAPANDLLLPRCYYQMT